MEFNSYLQKCSDNDVLSFGCTLLKWDRFKYLIKCALEPRDTGDSKVVRAINEDFTSPSPAVRIYPGSLIDSNESLDCEILRIGSSGWQKGKMKLKITLEFIPDQPEIEEAVAKSQLESPLDDLREMLKIDSQ